jgi:hypothetical protein
MAIQNAIELSPLEGVGVWIIEVRAQRMLVGYVDRNLLRGTYRYYRGADGMLLQEASDLGSLLEDQGLLRGEAVPSVALGPEFHPDGGVLVRRD